MAHVLPPGLNIQVRTEDFIREFEKVNELLEDYSMTLRGLAINRPPADQRLDRRPFGVVGHIRGFMRQAEIDDTIRSAVKGTVDGLRTKAPWCAACEHSKLRLEEYPEMMFDRKNIHVSATCGAKNCVMNLAAPGTKSLSPYTIKMRDGLASGFGMKAVKSEFLGVPSALDAETSATSALTGVTMTATEMERAMRDSFASDTRTSILHKTPALKPDRDVPQTAADAW